MSQSAQQAKASYEAMAPVYDDFTFHHNYALWLGNLLPKLERRGLTGNRLLDVACGTGKSFIWMLERGWEVTASDISPAMVARAEAKVGGRARLSIADMRALPLFGAFDLIWALGDAVNYMANARELEAALRGMGRNLAPGGLILFDANTLRMYRTFFGETMVVERGGMRLVWEGQAAPDAPSGSLAESRFRAERAGEVVAAHIHRQRHFPEAVVLAAIEAAGLTCLDVFGHDFDAVPEQPLDELRHTKAIFIVQQRKEEP